MAELIITQAIEEVGGRDNLMKAFNRSKMNCIFEAEKAGKDSIRLEDWLDAIKWDDGAAAANERRNNALIEAATRIRPEEMLDDEGEGWERHFPLA